MENENENLDSQIEEYQSEDITNLELDALKEKYQLLSDKHQKLTDTNRQLFQRAKKAEGFELKDGRWTKIQKPEPKPEPTVPKPSEIDFGELAFHNSINEVKIAHDDDVEYLKQTMKETGKSLKDILDSKFFQSELKVRQEARAVIQATPQARRSGAGAVDPLEIAYAKYIQTGELPGDFNLRTQVVNKRQEYEQVQNQFTPNPVVE